MDDKKALAMYRRHAHEAAALLLAMGEFSTLLLGHFRHGRRFDQAAANTIKARAVIYLKNLNSFGISIDEDAAVIGQAIPKLEQLIDTVVASAWSRDDL